MEGSKMTTATKELIHQLMKTREDLGKLKEVVKNHQEAIIQIQRTIIIPKRPND